jgi:acetyl-CoA carboxylase biotin carboxyl carrier protein
MNADVVAPITGVVWKILVSVGDEVAVDQSLVLLESMKMEVPVVAGQAGTVRELLVRPGDAVEEGDTVAKLET